MAGDDDELEWRAGRLLDEEGLLPGLGRTIVRRARAALGAAPRQRPRPVIVKVAAPARTRAAARRLARYVVRADADGRKDKPHDIFDRTGCELTARAGLELVEGWRLEEEERVSPRARLLEHAHDHPEWVDRLRGAREDDSLIRRLLREAGVHAGTVRNGRRLVGQLLGDVQAGLAADALDQRQRHGRILVHHIILSAPSAGRVDLPAFEIGLRDFVVSTVGAWGHECLTAIHREDGGHLHAHLLVRGRSASGAFLRFDKHALLLDHLRAALADALTVAGLSVAVEATRHADRPEVVQALVEGQGHLGEIVPGSRPAPGRLGRGGTLPSPDPRRRPDRTAALLRKNAPCWLAHHGEGLVLRRRGEPDPTTPPRTRAECPAGYGDLADWLAGERLFVTARGEDATVTALMRLHQMRVEEAARRRAAGRRPGTPVTYWLLKHRPEVFAPARRSIRIDPARLKTLLDRLPEPVRRDPGEPDHHRVGRVMRALEEAAAERDAAALRDVRKVVRHMVGLAHADETHNPGAAAMERAVELRDRAATVSTARLPGSGRPAADLDLGLRAISRRSRPGGRGPSGRER